jgi:DNA recombination protein RmuC
MTIQDFGLILASGAIGAAVVWFMARRGQGQSGEAANLRQHLQERFDHMSAHIDRRLQENVHAMNESKSFLAQRVSSAERTVREVSTTLSKLEHATTALKNSTDEISSFQNLLKSPKVRGSFGEVLLTNLLADVLPHDRFETQYTFPSTNEIADAIIRLQDGYIVAIDAKFPLSNYEAYARADDRELKARLRITVLRDIKKHVADIARKYIVPQAQTLDYAFMYIPVEGVYYETMVAPAEGESIWDYCLQQHIVPVSPNSFLAYLQTILVGLRGMKIEQQAREILVNISQIQRDFQQFSEDFSMVGKHITNAKNRFDDSARRLDKFQNRLEQIEGENPVAALPPSDDREAV